MLNRKIKIREEMVLQTKMEAMTAIHLLRDLEIKIEKLFQEVKEKDKAVHITQKVGGTLRTRLRDSTTNNTSFQNRIEDRGTYIIKYVIS